MTSQFDRVSLGAKNALQAIDNAGALGWRLEDAEVARLDAASAQVGK